MPRFLLTIGAQCSQGWQTLSTAVVPAVLGDVKETVLGRSKEALNTSNDAAAAVAFAWKLIFLRRRYAWHREPD